MANNREISQFAGLVTVNDTNNQVSIGSTLNLSGGGKLGIGTDNPVVRLDVVDSGSPNIALRGSSFPSIRYSGLDGITDAEIYYGAGGGDDLVLNNVNGGPIAFKTTNTEAARITSAGRLLVGQETNQGSQSLVQIREDGFGRSLEIFRSYDNGTTPPRIRFAKSRGTEGSPTTVANGDILAEIRFHAHDGTDYNNYAAMISVNMDNVVASDQVPGRLVFSTTNSAGSSPTERLRITSGGDVTTTANSSFVRADAGFTARNGDSVSICRDNGTPLELNRTSTDGNLINFFAQGTVEGTISVSGSTVSYNGGHLSRWSQLASGVGRTQILRGSVLSNLDEMCKWGDEDNEQLNRMKVSDVEGDRNVAGVFQAWDDDDDTYTNDFYCAMTGDFVIRIAQGTTVARGDLLMSAGDGTAKPQGDDIVRSKTVAKVTSTVVSETYADGSYCVPCVLMAC